MISATTEIYQSMIEFSLEKQNQRRDKGYMERIDTGFFSLLLSSNLTVGNDTTVLNLMALNNAFLSAASMSSV